MSFWLVMLCLVAALLWVHRTQRQALEWLLKPAAAATFVVAGATSGALETDCGRVLFVGLLFAAGGDVALIPKRKPWFLVGLGSFLLGHVAYAIAFLVRGVDLGFSLGTALLLGLGSLPVLRWLWPHVEKPMRAPVLAYVFVISLMVALGVGTSRAHGNWLLALGAIGFYLSDLSVAKDRFVGQSFLNRAWGLPLYFCAQLVLATAA